MCTFASVSFSCFISAGITGMQAKSPFQMKDGLPRKSQYFAIMLLLSLETELGGEGRIVMSTLRGGKNN